MAKTMNHTGSWLAIGTGVGVALGAALDNFAVGIALGAGVGIAIGSSLDRRDAQRAKSKLSSAERGE
ncbi:MAG: hypothetical protein Kow0074_04810 [Candidatus Zixiibacteriota bacterium]